MDRHKVIANHVAALTETVSVYVPPLQLTEGQPPPIAANGGLSYMSFDRDGHQRQCAPFGEHQQ